jgi:hypothetical protein
MRNHRSRRSSWSWTWRHPRVTSKGIADKRKTAPLRPLLFATALGLVLGAAPAAAHHIPGATYTPTDETVAVYGAAFSPSITVSRNGGSATVNFPPGPAENPYPTAQGPFAVTTLTASSSKPWDRHHRAGTDGCVTVPDPYRPGYVWGGYATSVQFIGLNKAVIDYVGSEKFPTECYVGELGGPGWTNTFTLTTSASPQGSEECRWARRAVRKAKKQVKQAESPQAERKAKKRLKKFKSHLC